MALEGAEVLDRYGEVRVVHLGGDAVPRKKCARHARGGFLKRKSEVMTSLLVLKHVAVEKRKSCGRAVQGYVSERTPEEQSW